MAKEERGSMTVREAGRKAVEAPSAVGVSHCLRGIDFPATKSQILDYAEQQDCPEDITQVLEQLADETYTSMAHLEARFGEIQ